MSEVGKHTGRMRWVAWVCVALIAVFVGCDSGTGSGAEPPEPADGGAPDQASCGTATASLPPGLTELAYDNGNAAGSVRSKSLGITYNNVKHTLGKEPTHEAVRFEIERPAKVYGFRVKWDGID